MDNITAGSGTPNVPPTDLPKKDIAPKPEPVRKASSSPLASNDAKAVTVKISPEIAAASAEIAMEASKAPITPITSSVMPVATQNLDPSVQDSTPATNAAPIVLPSPIPEAARTDRASAPTPTPAAAPTSVHGTPDADSKKPLLYAVLAGVLVLLVGGLTAVWIGSHKTARKSEIPKVAVDPRKDIPSITYTFSDDYPNAFPPSFPTQTIGSVIDRQIFETLVGFKDQNKLVPLLAKSWTNTDNNTWVFKLTPNVTFHTGRVMEAIDVKSSIEAAQKEAGYAVFTSTIKTIEIVDPLTVKITTKQPDAVLLNRLSFIFIFDSKSSKKYDAINGSGPYVLKPGTSVATKHTELVAFDNYHGGHVYTRQLVFQTVNYSDPAVIAALKNHTYQLATSMTDAQYDDLSTSVAGSKIATFSTNSVFSLMLNTVKGPLAKLKLRQALLYTIDPQKLIDASGISAVVASQAVDSTVPGYNPSIVRPSLDIAKAKQLVVEAGYPKGVTLNMATLNSQQKYVDPLVKQLAEIGVTVKPTLVENTKFFEFVERGGADINLGSYNSDINDAGDIYAALLQSGNVYSLYSNPAIDKLQAEANTIFEPQKRLLKLQEIATIASEDVPLIPIRTRTGKAYLDKNYGYTFDFPANILLGINFWQMYQK